MKFVWAVLYIRSIFHERMTIMKSNHILNEILDNDSIFCIM